MAKKPPKMEAPPKAETGEQAPKFVPCRQCGNPGGCARAAKCSKGFK